jgi:hypothetical protein
MVARAKNVIGARGGNTREHAARDSMGVRGRLARGAARTAAARACGWRTSRTSFMRAKVNPPVVDQRALCWPMHDGGVRSISSERAASRGARELCGGVQRRESVSGRASSVPRRSVRAARRQCACPRCGQGQTACAESDRPRATGRARCGRRPGRDGVGRRNERYNASTTTATGGPTGVRPSRHAVRRGGPRWLRRWRVALRARGLGVACDEQAPFERCNGFDDDCDGQTDGDFRGKRGLRRQ